jgi:hypothetical protein
MLGDAGFEAVEADKYKIDAHIFGSAWLPRWGMMSFAARRSNAPWRELS